MYSVSVIFKNSNTTLGFTFRTLESARALYGRLAAIDDEYVVNDDFGLSATLHGEDIAGVTLLNMGSEFDKQGEIALLQLRSQAKSRNMANSDPALALSRSLVSGSGN